MKLHGIRVLDFSQFMAGPLVSTTLADHGADVIKIESLQGDPTRNVGPGSGLNGSDFFASLNRGKRSVSIDLKSSESRDVVRQLVETADILVESYSAGVTQRLGIDYATVREWNPRIIYCSITAFGQSGPLSGMASHDQLVQAAAGTFTFGKDGAPIVPTVPIAGAVAGYAALSGILIALLAARQGRGGDHLDLSMFDATLTTRPTAVGHALQALHEPEGYHFKPGVALLETYETADAHWISLGAHEPRFAKALFNRLGRPDLIPLANAEPGEAQDPVRAFLRTIFISENLDTWQNWAKDTGISLGPVLNFAQALGHPHTSARKMLIHDHAGRAHLGTPINFTNEPGSPNMEVAALGQHSIAVLSEVGIDPALIQRLVTDGVVHSCQIPR
ncbi:CoA transferase [Pseudomonas sp. RGM2987]|nr:CoA transferase [Pseudomonas sp. RGM2987]